MHVRVPNTDSKSYKTISESDGPQKLEDSLVIVFVFDTRKAL